MVHTAAGGLHPSSIWSTYLLGHVRRARVTKQHGRWRQTKTNKLWPKLQGTLPDYTDPLPFADGTCFDHLDHDLRHRWCSSHRTLLATKSAADLKTAVVTYVRN